MPDLGSKWGTYEPNCSRERVARLASRQSGRVARRQLSQLGATRAQVRNWVRGGFLIPRLPGVYAVGHDGPSVKAQLVEALLYAGPGAMLTGAVAAWWLGLRDHRPEHIEVATPKRCGSLSGIHVRGRRDFTRTWHRDLPIAPVAEVLVHYAVTASHSELRRALAQTEYHGYIDLDLLLPRLRHGKTGSHALRTALTAHDPRLARVRSPLEIDFLELCRRYGIPAPEVNVRVAGLEVDMLWRAEGVAVELDGGGQPSHGRTDAPRP